MSSLRVAIGQAYHLKFDPKLWSSMQPYPPLGSLYAAKVARDNDCDVQFHDAMLSESVDDWSQFLDRVKPDLAVLQEDNFNYLSKMCLGRMRSAATQMIKAANARGIDVVVGGSDVTDHPDYYLRSGARYAMQGESEVTLAGVIQRMADGTASEISELDGITTLRSNELIARDRPALIRNLDSLGFPAWDLVDLDRYKAIWLKRHGYFSINMVSTRGCPYRCNWCAKPLWGQRYHSRTPEDVVAEMAHLTDLIGPDHIWFMDDIFGLKPGWIEQFAQALKARNLQIPYKCLSRADLLLRAGEVSHLADSGCATVWIGAESGSQKILDAMDKGITTEQIEKARRLLGTHGIRTGFFIQFGYPGEGIAEIHQTLGMIRRALPDDMGVSVAYPLPGTKFFENVKHRLTERTHWEDSDDLAMLFDGPFPTYFYRWLHRTAHADLNLHRSWARLRSSWRRSGFRELIRLLYQSAKWLGLRTGLTGLRLVASGRQNG